MRVSYAIVFVSDMKASLAFYRDVMGFPVRFETTHWSEFATEGATLALHLSEGSPAENASPGMEPAGRCRPGLSVPDLAEFHRKMVERGVPCVQEPKVVFGVPIAQYTDPDGLVVSVSQRA